MLEDEGGDPSSSIAVCPEQTRIRSAPLTSTACEKPNALDHSQGFTSVRSIGFPLVRDLLNGDSSHDYLSATKHHARIFAGYREVNFTSPTGRRVASCPGDA